MKVFLGGTVNGSKWRDDIIPLLKIDYFNPVVDVWDDEALINEEEAKKTSDYFLFVITPKMNGFYSIAEVVDSSNKKPENTILCILKSDDGDEWTPHQLKSISQMEKMLRANGAVVFDSLDEVVEFLNSKA